jgi:hypothetical protein
MIVPLVKVVGGSTDITNYVWVIFMSPALFSEFICQAYEFDGYSPVFHAAARRISIVLTAAWGREPSELVEAFRIMSPAVSPAPFNRFSPPILML